MSVCLLIQEIKHVLDGQGKSAAPVHSAEQGLKQVIHELLQGALGEGQWDSMRWRAVEGGNRQQMCRPDGAWANPALKTCLRSQAEQTVLWGWAGNC